MRPIDADHLKETLDNLVCESDNRVIEKNTNQVLHDLMPQVIADEPTIDMEPIKHGHWIRGKNKSAFPAKPSPIWYCSCCGEMIRYNDSTCVYQKIKKKVNEVNPRCRRCGARMDGDLE